MRMEIIVLGTALLASSAAYSEERQARIEVGGLWCPSCSYIVGESFEKSASVEVLDYAPSEDGTTAIYTVRFDDEMTNLEEIASQPAAYGYTAVPLNGAIESSG